MKHSAIIWFVIIVSLGSLACRATEFGSTVVSPEPLLKEPAPIVSPVPTANSGELPATTIPVSELATVPAGAPLMTATVNLNVRRGPSVQYDIVTILLANETVQIVGRSPDGFWWKLVCPSSYNGECWSSAKSNYSSAVNAESVPVAAVPLAPTATNTPTSTHTPTPT
ncbi:MAG: SH3 domain-containing protein, partial [Chloroflexi bacterium]|nr:SH3 domain-containing protein [Chloroflexota bacterium]